MRVTETEASEVAFLDLANPKFSIRSQAVRDARAKNWYARTSYGLAVLRHAEVGALLRDARLRQGSYKWPAHNNAAGLFADWWLRMLLNRIGSDHSRLRRLVNPAFGPKIVTPLTPRFEEIANDLIDNFASSGRCEFMSEFAEPYATRVICELLHLSQEHWRTLADISADMGLALGVTYGDNQERVNAATARLFGFAHRIIEDCRKSPDDGFISHLVEANKDKSALSDQELDDMVVLAVFGGIDTTRNQIGLGMSVFIENPESWKLLGKHPELARGAVEEVMRTRPTTTWVTREALEDIVFKDVLIRKGTTLHMFTESAGTDPSVYAPGIDITEERKTHYGFGAGPHHCLGHFIARADMTEALRLLAQRVKNPVYDGEPKWLPDSGNTGPVSLPIRFDPQA
jgi:cytochrome P450